MDKRQRARCADGTARHAGLLAAVLLVAAVVAGCGGQDDDLDCDQGARRGLGVPADITARVAVYFGTEQDARAFAEEVQVRPRPTGHAAAILYCLD